jgi:hypothetical protein
MKWFCDRCNKEILPEDYTLHLEVQEELYKGKNDFFIDTNCSSKTFLLCDQCNSDLKEFIKHQVVYY